MQHTAWTQLLFPSPPAGWARHRILRRGRATAASQPAASPRQQREVPTDTFVALAHDACLQWLWPVD
eukprot:4989028-Alexandrium_andersonii.AAC.1